MTPNESLDMYKNSISKHIVKDQYSKEEVQEIVNKCFKGFYNSIIHSNFILELENEKAEVATVNNKDFSLYKFAKDGGYIVIMNFLDDGNIEDLTEISQSISDALQGSDNVKGVLLMPTSSELSIIKAKIDMKCFDKDSIIDVPQSADEHAIIDTVIYFLDKLKTEAYGGKDDIEDDDYE